ncbi:hypothetical protein [Aliiglaciecola lipolytica]|uniref:Uncharacterized protein n=1 Tax=Aliiglaciecola lipolytica E3 TaxID=1127673 RepID=K6YEB3_9ALTE|nr:hypothetical protein [Aliiglaciecola lipolytica]GAC16507.1 hypothetical protein GLIP_3896 [Aliiglaciecola lipolytica E3]
MDPQFEQWQQSFQEGTPKVDVHKLAMQVSKNDKREKAKAWIDLIAGCCVSAFCVYFLLVYADTTLSKLLVATLSPIPLAFSLWAFRLRQSQSIEHSLDINQLLEFKRKKLYNQVYYWKVSAIVLTGLWLGLVAFAGVSFIYQVSDNLWLTQVLIQTIVLIVTWGRFVFLKKHLHKRITAIDALR